MATVGKYCKTYPTKQLRQFSGWTEKAENVKKEKQIVDGQESEIDRVLTKDDYLYLQENYVVTDGIFKDEHTIFDDVTPEWIAFCQQMLEFEVPAWARSEPAEETDRGS